MTEVQSLSRARKNVIVLVAAQAILGAQMSMIFTYAGLAGQNMATNICFATLPISMIVLGSMLAASPLSSIMQRFGRRVGFFVGAFGGMLGASVSAYGLYAGSFALLLLGSLITGVYMSSQGFFRFAAVDTAPEHFRAKAISWVMAGGLISAFIGPQLGKMTVDSTAIPFMGVYLSVVVLNLIGSLLFLFLDIPKPPAPAEGAVRGRTRWEMIKTPRILVAVICGMVSYALMNLVMTSTPLAVVGCGFGNDAAADVVTGHVVAMFAPSFFTGHLIARFGVEKIVATGLAILAMAGVVALSGVELSNFFIALILLGIGWNFGFIGATTMLATAHTPEERGRMQGLNDMIVFGFVTLASLASGSLMNCSGGTAVEGWTSVNIAMIPFLALAGSALIWLVMQPKDASVEAG
ncbi:MFS transporter [Falsihalocynthiibacter sp. SS001]|uniref:MFS transporter n=1 Tax=Falsihalocynthiibacter sp. SS001 TaxID=3349698 RepID=UPI0036D37758